MKSGITMYVTALTLFSVLAIPLQLAGKDNPQRGLKYIVLYTFTGGTDGGTLNGGLIEDESGNLYGTTTVGGAVNQCAYGYGCGVVFKFDSAGNYTVLYTFTGGSDGGNPFSDLARDEQGNLYGTTAWGGDVSCGCGVVFKLDPVGNYTVLHTFHGVDGNTPVGGLARDESGNLYGTTSMGGDINACNGEGCGVVFKLDLAGNYTVLYTFSGANGVYPLSDLVRDQVGNLYGTTLNGGDLNNCEGEGCGVVFKINPTGNYTVLYAFAGGIDGGQPYAGLVRDADGNLYGTTFYGGDASCGCGVVFKLDPTCRETVLYTFTGGADGANPSACLVRDNQGNFYGTTLNGGGGAGVVFKLDTTRKETVLYTFTGGADGGQPFAGLLRDKDGNLYGDTLGYNSYGNLFKISVCSTALCLGN